MYALASAAGVKHFRRLSYQSISAKKRRRDPNVIGVVSNTLIDVRHKSRLFLADAPLHARRPSLIGVCWTLKRILYTLGDEWFSVSVLIRGSGGTRLITSSRTTGITPDWQVVWEPKNDTNACIFFFQNCNDRFMLLMFSKWKLIWRMEKKTVKSAYFFSARKMMYNTDVLYNLHFATTEVWM